MNGMDRESDFFATEGGRGGAQPRIIFNLFITVQLPSLDDTFETKFGADSPHVRHSLNMPIRAHKLRN